MLQRICCVDWLNPRGLLFGTGCKSQHEDQTSEVRPSRRVMIGIGWPRNGTKMPHLKRSFQNSPHRGVQKRPVETPIRSVARVMDSPVHGSTSLHERTPAPCSRIVTGVQFIRFASDPPAKREPRRRRTKAGTYIIPGIPPMPPMSGMPPPPPAPPFSGLSAIMASVVSSNPETDAAFCSEVRTTLAGSMTPALIRSS